MTDWKGKRVTVMGLGLFSGGVAVTRFLARQGARVTVTDLKNEKDLSPSVRAIGRLPVRLVLGRHDEADFRDADCVIRSPAVPDDSPYLEVARRHNVPIDCETNIFFRRCAAKIVGVTGSNGKSTTAALLGSMLETAGFRTHVGGNIGRSLLDDVEAIKSLDLVVMELSSFQLQDLAHIRKSPHGAVVTNLSPNHLDRHGSYENYCDAKKNIIRFQDERKDFAVLNADCADLASWKPACGRVLRFSRRTPVTEGAFARGEDLFLARSEGAERFLASSDIPLRGEHNVENVLAAAAAACTLDAPAARIARAVRSFKALPHRLERVGAVAGVDCYNDSIATTPEAAVCALKSFDAPVILVAGGYDKGADFTDLAREIASRARLVILIGRTAERIAKLISRARKRVRAGRSDSGREPDETSSVPPCRCVEVLRASSLEEAVASAFDRAVPGDILLLSPACASYDMFTNFQDRGDRFRNLVLSRGSSARK